MRWLMMLLLLTFGAALLTVSSAARSQAQDGSPCEVTFNHEEALRENRSYLTRQMIFLQTEPPPLADPDILSVTIVSLSGIRRFHEGLAADLPVCALPLNDATIETAAALQDVMTERLFAATGSSVASRARLDQLVTHLDLRFAALSDRVAATPLVALP